MRVAHAVPVLASSDLTRLRWCSVNREDLLENLTLAEQRIGNAEFKAARLRQDLARLERAGEETREARQALQLCDEMQGVHRAERTRLLSELAASRREQC